MQNTRSSIGLVSAVAVTLVIVPMLSGQSDELPRRLRDRISHARGDGGSPSVATGGFDAESRIFASDGERHEAFGASVAISGDTAIVGAKFDDVRGMNSGSVYVFQRDEGGIGNWGEVIKITASDEVTADRFGFSVAIGEDVAIVGARGDDRDAGSAYVLQRNEGGIDNWGEIAKIMGSDRAADDLFGTSVAISGDTVIVGAPWEDESGDRAGAAYVFQRNEGGVNNWGEVLKILPSDGTNFSTLGDSVAISGDTAIVGGRGTSQNGLSAGSAYVFQRDVGGIDRWGEVAKILPSDGAQGDLYGDSVAISGDTAIVGAYSNDDNGERSGSAYIFRRDEGGADNWGELTKLTASDAAADDIFGVSVSISGDTAIVGASRDDDACFANAFCQSGSAYVFQRDEGGMGNWGEVTKITASDAAFDDKFGGSVAISGATAIISATGDNGYSIDSGSAYVLERKPVAVPTIAGWGIMAMTLLLPIAMTIKFGRRHHVSR